jgi:hypothetical protein
MGTADTSGVPRDQRGNTISPLASGGIRDVRLGLFGHQPSVLASISY